LQERENQIKAICKDRKAKYKQFARAEKPNITVFKCGDSQGTSQKTDAHKTDAHNLLGNV
jgi:hypothetical protein